PRDRARLAQARAAAARGEPRALGGAGDARAPLPHAALLEPPLDAQALAPQHPLVERGERRGRVPEHDAPRRDGGRPGEALAAAERLARRLAAGRLLGQGRAQVLGRDAELLAEREELRLVDSRWIEPHLLLQLQGADEDALARRPVERWPHDPPD